MSHYQLLKFISINSIAEISPETIFFPLNISLSSFQMCGTYIDFDLMNKKTLKLNIFFIY